MVFDFLVETYRTERLKVLSVWSMFRDTDLSFRPDPEKRLGRSVLEHMVHQCMSENLWFQNVLGIDIAAPPLPNRETRRDFIQRYAKDSRARLQALEGKSEKWWSEEVEFFDTLRSRAWVMVRRVAHTAHHRGQQIALLRMLNRPIYSTYGPTADTGGLPKEGAGTIYAYPDEKSLLREEPASSSKAVLPGPGPSPPTERPEG